MKKKLFATMMAIAVSVSCITPAAVSRGNGRGRALNYVDANGDGICDYFGTGRGCGRWFTDANGDGICDNFKDADGDGVCDYFQGRGAGRRNGCAGAFRSSRR